MAGPQDETLKLILAKAGYGLARPAWLRTLQEIRNLPTHDRRTHA